MRGNKHKYSISRIIRFTLAPAYTLLTPFLRKTDNIVITASHNNEYSDNAKALFEILIKREEYGKRVYYILNDEDKRESLNKLYPGKFISNLSFNNILLILRSRYWFCSSMELPLGIFFQRYFRQVIHLGHGMVYKKVGLMETHVHWYKKIYYAIVTSNFSHSIATTEFCRRYIADSFGLPLNRVLLTPQPKTAQIAFPKRVEDPILNDSNLLNILYAPTWRPYADVELFPFEDFDALELNRFLQENNVHIWIRVHPRFEQNITLSIDNIHLFSAKEYIDINQYLQYFGSLITDYSSIYYDFLTLERPVLFFDYDFQKYNDVIGIIEDYKHIKCTETTITQSQFKQQLLDIKAGNYNKNKIRKVNQIINYPIANSEIAGAVLNKIKII